MLLRKDLIKVGQDYPDRETALHSFAELFVERGVAKPSYPQAIVDREKIYPTGLPAGSFDIALSHCDSEHVIEPAIGVCTLVNPIDFQMMGGDGTAMHVKIIFMLAIKDPDSQISTLQKLMGVLQNEGLLEEVHAASSPEEVYDALKPYLDV
ncbi:MAG: PTS sugar transporter subunit IIA [Atopobiaceae bacterium]|jgi:PTS system galactitol-specific IIA component|nr:PTS sugar transporter subunit IIA [Atopobiaceae bacterium]MCI2172624.1 PTS sugar transporter subunit IIA [Atopobiaceae bacterium]MCI2206931.1 PTS sugar transporter subunit IIA [Atopobiaceae bacterium]